MHDCYGIISENDVAKEAGARDAFITVCFEAPLSTPTMTSEVAESLASLKNVLIACLCVTVERDVSPIRSEIASETGTKRRWGGHSSRCEW